MLERASPGWPPWGPRPAVVASVLVGSLYFALALAQAVYFGPSFSGGSYPVLYVLAVSAVGVPVFLFLRHRLLAPLVLAVAIVAFWHGYAFAFGSEGDSPVFGIAFAFAPFYLVGYAVLALGEVGLRRVL